MSRPLAGVLAAAVTPLRPDLTPDLDAWPLLLDHLACLGCHGAVVLGTTGEGPSFSTAERAAIVRAAAAWRSDRRPAEFRLVAGTGCANLPETVALTQAAFAAGIDAVLLLPAFYFKAVTAAGVTAYLARVFESAVPPGGRVLLYHIPGVSGVPIAFETVAALREAFPGRCAGIKDSGGDPAHTLALCHDFPELAIFTGTDGDLAGALAAGAAGSITALANLCGDLARTVYDGHQAGRPDATADARLRAARSVLDRYPAVPAVKALLAERHGLPLWPVRPPLPDLALDVRLALADEFAMRRNSAHHRNMKVVHGAGDLSKELGSART
jgi:4-hydroxy-tetrahydrodipicolinate synthase